MFTFRTFAAILSGPDVLPFFIFLMAWIISALVGFSLSIGWSILAAGMHCGLCGVGLLSKFLKCSAHLMSCSSLLIMRFSLFVLDVLFRFGGLAQPCLYDVVQFFQVLVPAACSASSARLSVKCCLSFFTLSLTSLWALLYSAWAEAFPALVLLWFDCLLMLPYIYSLEGFWCHPFILLDFPCSRSFFACCHYSILCIYPLGVYVCFFTVKVLKSLEGVCDLLVTH